MEEKTFFDREYGLDDLLPEKVLKELAQKVLKMGMSHLMLLHRDGSLHFQEGDLNLHQEQGLLEGLKNEKINEPRLWESGHSVAGIFPVAHELETVGYLVLGSKENGIPPSMNPLGEFLLHCIQLIIQYRYKHLLTSGLHGQVVEESYAEIKEKAALLEASERKYRLLAENLEKEVERKTKEMEEASLRMLQQDKLASVGRLAAGVAHEINNPIGFVKSNLGTLEEYRQDLGSLLKSYLLLEEAVRKEKKVCFEKQMGEILEELNRIKAQTDIDFLLEDHGKIIQDSLEGTERVSRIVRDLQDFTHLDRSEKEYTLINEQLQRTASLLRSQLPPGVEVILCPGRIPPVECYPRSLNQAFMNILFNAAEAVALKGTVRIVTRCEEQTVEIQFTDTGSGIPAHLLPKIFDPFFTTRDVGRGMGLGLNTAYRIVQDHGGTIAVESTVGKGSTFTIRLPVSPSSASVDGRGQGRQG